jgi:hypothetical protein
MLYDKNLLFSDAQSLIAGAGTVLCTNSIDTGSAQAPPQAVTQVASAGIGGPLLHDWGRIARGDLELVIELTTTVTSGGAATLQIQFIQADDGALTTNVEVLEETRAYALALLVQGSQFPLRSPVGVKRRFIGVQYVIGTAAITAGAVFAGYVGGRQSNINVLAL